MMDLFQIITDRIVAELEQGIISWKKPWSSAQGAISHTTGKRYSLLNQMLLGCRSGEFVTFKEAQREGGHIRKGEKASMIVFWKFLDSAKRDDDGNVVHGADGKPVMESVPFLRYYNVFHIDQCEGIRPRFAEEAKPGEQLSPDEAADRIVEDYIQRSGVKLHVQHSDRAFYSPSSDSVTVPDCTVHQRQRVLQHALSRTDAQHRTCEPPKQTEQGSKFRQRSLFQGRTDC